MNFPFIFDQIKILLRRFEQKMMFRFRILDRFLIIQYTCIAGVVYLIAVTFHYTVLDNEYYQNLANKQQTLQIKNTSSRGSIYSKNTPSGVFSTSTDLFDLAIDPQAPVNKTALGYFLVDLLLREFCPNGSDEKCAEEVFLYTKWDQLDTLPRDLFSLKGLLLKEVTNRINKSFIDFVLAKENISDAQKGQLRNLTMSGFQLLGSNIYFLPGEIQDTVVFQRKMQEILNLPGDEIAFKSAKRPARYVRILRKMSLNTRDIVEKRIEIEKENISKGLIESGEGIIASFILEPRPTRFYPEKTLASQIIGFVDNEGKGQYGVEGYLDQELQGKEGLKIAKKDIQGRPIGSYNFSEKRAINGANIVLTIDRNIQKEVSKMVKDALIEFRANQATVLIMDPKTGAIITSVSYPDFDPNEFASVYEIEKVSYSKYPNPLNDLRGIPLFVEDEENGASHQILGRTIKIREANEEEVGRVAIQKYKYKNNLGPGAYQNAAISSLYEPGSVFKAVTTAIGIDTGDIRPGDTYFDKGYAEIDTFKIKNVSSQCLGRNSYTHALDFSCNVGMIDIVQKIGKTVFHKYITEFGFGAPTGITLEGEIYGKLESPERWSRAKLFTMSFGQGITATVLQMATAYCVLANGGIYMKPYIIDSITYGDGSKEQNSPQPLRRVIKEETSKKITAMLVHGAQVGFAKKGGVEGYDVAGKTGTSQIASKGRYETGGAGHTITSFGGFAPASNPKFVMIVRVDRPRTSEFAENTASALYGKISKYLLNYYAIPKGK